MSKHLDRLIGKAKNRDFFDDPDSDLFASKTPARTEKHAVKRDRLDKIAYDITLDRVTALSEQIEEGAEKHPTQREAYEDLFNLLNQGDPRFVEQARMLDEYGPQHALLQGMYASEDFRWIRTETKYDEYNTALAMLTMKDRMDQSFDQMQEQIDAIKQAMQDLADAIAKGEAVLEMGNPAPGQADEAAEALAEAMGRAAMAQMEGEGSAADVQAMMEKALREAKDAIERERETMSGYGIGDGELKRMSFDERRALAERLDNSRMERLAKLLGNFRQYADAERRRKVTAVPAEVYDVELGSDLEMLVSSELNNMAMPEVEDLFWLRWQKRELLQNRVRGAERAGKGPIIALCDESGSMGTQLDNEGNTREAWSKAVVLALADQAFRAKRDFTYIGFSSQRQVWETTFPKGQMNREQVVAFTEHFFAGGTSYEGPIQRAAQIIREYADRGLARPDVVFITDDSCRVNDQFVEWWSEVRKAADVRCYGLQIGGEPYANQLKNLSDHCMSIDSLNAHPAGVVELFRTI